VLHAPAALVVRHVTVVAALVGARERVEGGERRGVVPFLGRLGRARPEALQEGLVVISLVVPPPALEP